MRNLKFVLVLLAGLYSLPAFMQVVATATVHHINPNGVDSLGGIILQPSGGKPPYTYAWSAGTYPGNKDRIQVPPGTYDVVVTDANNNQQNFSYNLAYKANWTSFYGAAASGDNLTVLDGPAHVISANNELIRGADGWAELIIQDVGSSYLAGFRKAASGDISSISDVEFGFYVAADRALYVYENGSYTYLGITADIGSAVRIDRKSNYFRLLYNGNVIYSDGMAYDDDYLSLKVQISGNMPMYLGCSFSDLYYPDDQQVYVNLTQRSNDGVFDDGSIALSISGNAAPYTVNWSATGSDKQFINDLAPGTYDVSVTGYQQDPVNYSYRIGYAFNPSLYYGAVLRNDSLVIDTLYSDYPPSAVGKNILKANTAGWVDFRPTNWTSSSFFGFINGNSTLEATDDILYGFYIDDASALYAYADGAYSLVSFYQPGNVITLGRDESGNYFVAQNGSILDSRVGSQGVLKLRVEPIDNLFLNLGCSFNMPLQVDYTKNSILDGNDPNSGSIYLTPKYGVKPYTYAWSNSSTSDFLTNLAAGTYDVTVTDGQGDSQSLSFRIGYASQWTNISNMTVNSDGNLAVVDKATPASAFTDRYITGGGNGYYEFSVLNANSNFNFLLQPYDVSKGLGATAPVIVRQSIIKKAARDLPAKGTSAYNLINFADTISTGDSLNVIQKEFVTYPCNGCSRTSFSGIQVDYGIMYALNNGVTIQKGVAIQNNDLIRLQSAGGAVNVLQNGAAISQSNFANLTSGTTPYVGNTNMYGLPPESSWGHYAIDEPTDGAINLGNGTVGNVDTDISGNTVTEGGNCACTVDAGISSAQTTLYNDLGMQLSVSKQYYDYRGQVKQTQVMDFTDKKIIVTQPMYDAYGRNVGQTLPAPVNTSCFCYISDFIISSASGSPYSYNDFDIPNHTTSSSALTSGEWDKPVAVDNTTAYKLGWYYSDNNTWESYVPTAQTPYARVQYSSVDPSTILKASKPGSQLNSGSGHETYNFKMATSGELNTVFGSGLGWRIDNFSDYDDEDACDDVINPVPLLNTAPLSMKSISVDENGIENITFIDLTGNLIATCMSGQVNGANVTTQTLTSVLSFIDETQRYVDVHLPDGCANTMTISAPGPANYSTGGAYPIYNIINLKTGEYVLNSGSTDWYSTSNSFIYPVLPAGYYRVFVKSVPQTYLDIHAGYANITYNTNYYNFALNYYDYANRLKAAVPPAGLTPATYNTVPNHGNNRQNVSTISSSANSPAYFPVGKTWSMNSESFSDKIALSLPTQTANMESTSLDVTFSNHAAMGKGDDTSFGPGTATGDYNAIQYPLDTTHITVPDSIVTAQELHFKVKIALLDSRNTIIDGSTQESTDLVCTVKYDKNNTQYTSWTPVTFSYEKQASLSSGPVQWSNLQILSLEPVEPSLGDNYDLYASLTSDVVITVNTLRLSSSTTPAKTMAERYRYDCWDNTVSSISPEEGRTDMVYTLDGSPKYARNARENASNSNAYYRKYSFVSADILGRPLYSGENNPATQTAGTQVYFEPYEDQALGSAPYGSVPSGAVSVYNYGTNDLFDPTAWIGSTSDMMAMYYDTYDPQFQSIASALNPATYVQRHLSGRLSYSQNDNKKTWYSYDEFGRTEWVVQKYIGVNPGTGSVGDIIKTFQYKYDYSGNVGEIIYNAESTTDCLHHFYEYDRDNRLKRVYTQRPPVAPATTSPKSLQATYAYYMHGPLKRAEIGTQMQGTDYIYTINGWLKGMNSAELNSNNDPGHDGGYLGTGVPTSDLFGFDLEYYKQDYERTNSNVQTFEEVPTTLSFAPDQFNGVIKGQRWQTHMPAGNAGLLSYANQQLMYGYQYDKKYQLVDAKFGQVYLNADNNILHALTNVTNIPDYRVYNLTYDNNGNILSLKRDAYTGSTGGFNMDNLTYSYNSCSNQLLRVRDAISPNNYNTLGFKSGQANNNYIYDEIGELSSDASNNKKYEYNSLGDIIRIRDMSNNLVAEYTYDEAGSRIQKTVYLSGGTQKRTLYVRDGSGNIVATYDKTSATASYSGPSEWDIYAAGRVGILDKTTGTETYIYELTDHLGNVRATFMPQAKTSISTNFDTHVSGYDNGWFLNTSNSLTDAFDYSSNPVPNNYFVRTQKTAGTEYGAGSKLIPVKYGNSLTLTWKALWETGSLPNAGMEIKLTDAAGNPIGGASGLQYIAMVSSGGTNSWHGYAEAINITANYPDMYLSFYPHNKDNSGAVAFFDEFTLTFNTGAAAEPGLLNMADYYPHGSVMPGLNYNSSYKYRYGYQGQFAEMDDESNESNFDLRNYDGLLGRFKTTDPYGQYWSPYLAMGNSHPNNVDPDGGDAYTAAVGAVIGAAVGAGIAATYDAIKYGHVSAGDVLIGAGIGAGTGAAFAGIGWDKPTTGRYTNDGIFDGWESRLKEGNDLVTTIDLNKLPALGQSANRRPLAFTITIGKWVTRDEWKTLIDLNIVGPKLDPLIVPLRSNERFRQRGYGGQSGEYSGKVRRVSLTFWGKLKLWYYTPKNKGFRGAIMFNAPEKGDHLGIQVQHKEPNTYWRPFHITIKPR